ncbi:MAG: hypothetical protein F7C38_06600 [Desulfurococcales archaeon]|nr:hypothetical protein [Desulfurococcales archaeon]
MRRGLSELIGALILISAMSSIVAYMAYTSTHVSKIMEESVEDASRRLVLSSQPLYMSPRLENKTLSVVIYTFSPTYLKGIYYLKNDNLTFIAINKTIFNTSEIIVDDTYDCSPVRVYLEIGEGILIPYTPTRDPLALMLPDKIKSSIIRKTYIDCSYIETLFNATGYSNNPSTNSNETVVSIANEALHLVEGSPSLHTVLRGDPYTITTFKLRINGSGYPGDNIDFKLYTLDGDTLIASTTITVPSNNSPVARYIYTYNDDGRAVKLYGRVLCDISTPLCIIGIAFSPDASTLRASTTLLVSGDIQVDLKVNYHSSTNNCNYNNETYVLPTVYSPLSSFTSELDGTCRLYYGKTVDFKGWANGSFLTNYGIALLVSTSDLGKFDMNATLFLREVLLLNSTTAKAELQPLSADSAINYRLIKIVPSYSNAITKAMMQFMYKDSSKDLSGQAYIEMELNGVTVTRPVTDSWKAIPLRNITNLAVKYNPPEILPATTRIKVDYTHDSMGPYEYYRYNVSSVETPVGYPQYYPALILIKDIIHGSEYLVVLPVGDGYLRQFNNTYHGLAPLIGGIPINSSSADTIYINIIDLQSTTRPIRVPSDLYANDLAEVPAQEFDIDVPGNYVAYLPYYIDSYKLFKIIILIIY